MLDLTILDKQSVAKVCHALSKELRLNMLSLLESETLSCLELSQILGYPLSTISANTKILEEAGLITTQLLPAKNGSKKLCSIVYTDIYISLIKGTSTSADAATYEVEIPIGNYMDFQISPTCGFIGDSADKSNFDKPNYFLDPSRITAQLIWFRHGYLEYRIPLENLPSSSASFLAFELEICSEAPGFNNLLKSDITMWVNGIEIGSFRSSGDFGGRRGKYTPNFWDLDSTQYGTLTRWEIDRHQTCINNSPASAIVLNDLNPFDAPYVTMRIGIKKDAEYQGGLNLFGEKFGDYPHAIKMTIGFHS